MCKGTPNQVSKVGQKVNKVVPHGFVKLIQVARVHPQRITKFRANFTQGRHMFHSEKDCYFAKKVQIPKKTNQ